MTLSTSSSRAVRTRTGILAPARANAAEDLEAVDARQADVEHDEVRRLVRRRCRGPPRRSGRPRPRSPPAGGRTGCPRATAYSSSTMRMVAATRRCYTESCHRPASGRTVARPWYPTARSSGRLVAARPPASRSPFRSRRTNRHPEVRFHVHRHRPPDARRRAPRDHRQEGRRLRQDGRLPGVVYGHGVESTNVSRRQPTSSSSSAARRLERPGRPVGRRRQGPAGPRPRRPGPPGQPPAAPRRPVRGPDDRGADRRRAARGHRRGAGRRAQRRDAPPPDRDGQGPGAAGPPARSRSSTPIESLVDFDTTIHVRDLDDPRRRDAR